MATLTHTTWAGFKLATPSAPAISAGTVSGSLGVGMYSYKITHVAVSGESDASAASNVVATGSGSMNVTIPTGVVPDVISRKLYRTTSGGSSYALVAIIANNTATSYVDTLADAGLGAAAPSVNASAVVLTVLSPVEFTAPPVVGVATVAATGTTIADAALLPSTATTLLVTGADATKGVRLPSQVFSIGQQVTVVNTVAAVLKVYPSTSTGIIDGGAAGASINQAASISRNYVVTALTPTTWVSYV